VRQHLSRQNLYISLGVKNYPEDDIMGRDLTSIKVEKAIRDRLKSQKTGGETYGQLLDKMMSQYDPQGVDK